MDPRAPTGHIPYLHREVQAREELGHTQVRPWLAALFAGLFLGLIAGVPFLQLAGPEPLAPFRDLTRGARGAVRALEAEGFRATNRALLAAMERFEDRLEEESWVTEDLLPPVQLFLTGVLGAGSEQVVVGRDGWLFYRPAVDLVTGPGFLEEDVLEARRLAEERDPVEPDPRAVLLDLHRRLSARGIRLLVLPAPAKATVHPERLTPRPVQPPLHNPSFGDFVEKLRWEGIAVLDVAPDLVAAARADGEPRYLQTDTHWTPEGMDLAARAVAGWIEASVPLAGPRRSWRRAARQVEGMGDLARMLELPAGQELLAPQRVTVQAVVSGQGAGRPWEPDPSAEVLILGDSYTNVYSRADLGWGTGAGLAEQVAFHLGRPVDRIAVNAGGAWASRQALARELEAGRDRLAGKRVVVMELAARELAFGDWRRVDLPEGEP